MDGEQARNAGPERPRSSLVIRIAEMFELIRSRVFSLGAILLMTLPVRFERLESSSSVQESPFTRGAALLQAMSSSNQRLLLSTRPLSSVPQGAAQVLLRHDRHVPLPPGIDQSCKHRMRHYGQHVRSSPIDWA